MTNVVRHARYSSITSNPGGPNFIPAGVTACSLMELKPNCRCTVNIPTNRTTAIGMQTNGTTAPINTAIRHINSVPIVNQHINCGSGTPRPAGESRARSDRPDRSAGRYRFCRACGDRRPISLQEIGARQSPDRMAFSAAPYPGHYRRFTRQSYIPISIGGLISQ